MKYGFVNMYVTKYIKIEIWDSFLLVHLSTKYVRMSIVVLTNFYSET